MKKYGEIKMYLTTALSPDSKIVLTDSRQLTDAAQTIFFAIKGPIHDGHQYLLPLLAKGVKEFVVETSCPKNIFKTLQEHPDIKVWQVDSALNTLQQYATEHRERYQIPVIGITGSNGKTIVKEWLGQMLSQSFAVVKSPKSYNSQLGVPLSVLQINNTHSLGIFEAGISKPGEMQKLETIIKPNIGIFTNIGNAHEAFFESQSQKIEEKLKLFKDSEKLIYHKKDLTLTSKITEFKKTQNHGLKLIDWGFTEDCSYFVEKLKAKNSTYLIFNFKNEQKKLEVNLYDDASLENICHCIVAMDQLALPWSLIEQKVQILKSIPMRLALKQGINGNVIIDDSYNYDMQGLEQALDFQKRQASFKPKALILSDMAQLAGDRQAHYTQISNLLKQYQIDSLIAVGTGFGEFQHLFKQNSVFYFNTETLLANLTQWLPQHHSILIKGARSFGFERIVKVLEEKIHDTTLEINLDALTHNYNYYRKIVGQETKIMAMVKAFAYGAGNLEVAQLLQYHGIDYLGVAYTDEGVYLRTNGIILPIMVMNAQEDDFERIIEQNLEAEIYSIKKLKTFLEKAYDYNGFVKIHLKIDTGMHRLGFTSVNLDEVISLLRQNPNVFVASIFSHLAASESEKHDDYTLSQITAFDQMSNYIEAGLGYKIQKHILNSAGIYRWSQYKYDMVRLGIGLYGVSSNDTEQKQLQVVGTLKTKISQIKQVSAGQTVGYGRWGKLYEDSNIATIAIGYADGYDRRFGKGIGQVLINKKLYPIIGNICMDMCMVNLGTDIATEGDPVVIFGNNPTVTTLAQQIDTIPYEILTNIGQRVKRIFVKE